MRNLLILFIVLISFPFPVIAQEENTSGVSVVSCPIPGGKITTPSYQASQISGHCGGGYTFSCNCGSNGRRAKAIDIATGGKAAVLPMIEGKSVEWTLQTKNFSVAGGEGGGAGNTFMAQAGADQWYLDILHLNLTTLEQGRSYPSGTEIGTSVISHVHATVGKNLKGPVAAGTPSDCDPGWLPSDFMCDPTKQPPTTISSSASSSASQPSSAPKTGKSNKVCVKVGDPFEPNPCLADFSSQDISACFFSRGDLNPPEAQFKSKTLMKYFQEASAASGVPMPVLAGIARIESPSSVELTDENLESFSCPTSPTGARGIMQIQPPGTTGSPTQGIRLGAEYLDIDVDNLDYCNLRQSIFLGAGVVNSKRANQKWDPALTGDRGYIDSVASTYYGCLKYPSCANGPFSYGEDLWNSVQACKVTTPPVIGGGNTGQFVHYCQNDSKWPAASSCSLASSGCGPTSLAMALSTFGAVCNGSQCSPTEVDKLMTANGQRDSACNSVMDGGALSSRWLRDLGIETGPKLTAGGALDYELAKRFINDGYLIIGSSARAPSCNCNHIFVVQDVNPGTKDVMVRDPICRNGAEADYNAQYKSINWMYAYPIKKVR